MTAKHYIAATLASFVTLASVAPAFADSYYDGIDINNPRGSLSAPKKTSVARDIRTQSADYGYPGAGTAQPVLSKGGEGEYYQGINRR
ncbi:hypothetical protein M1D34_30435 (plasmid) [Ensifer sp. D2-11]